MKEKDKLQIMIDNITKEIVNCNDEKVYEKLWNKRVEIESKLKTK